MLAHPTPLFDNFEPPSREPLEEGAILLRQFAAAEAPALVEQISRIAETAPFRHLTTPSGYSMSVAMTNCGRVGWVSDRKGYRYDPLDPDSAAWTASDGIRIASRWVSSTIATSTNWPGHSTRD